MLPFVAGFVTFMLYFMNLGAKIVYFSIKPPPDCRKIAIFVHYPTKTNP